MQPPAAPQEYREEAAMSLKEVLEECLYEEIYSIRQPYIEMRTHALVVDDSTLIIYLENSLEEINQALRKGFHFVRNKSEFDTWLSHQDLKRCELYLARVAPAYEAHIAEVKKYIQMLKLLDLSD